MRRGDFEAAKSSLEAAGFQHRRSHDADLFLDNPGADQRDGARVVFVGERRRLEDTEPSPDISEAAVIQNVRTLPLECLVRMNLSSFRLLDRVQLRDMIDVGLIDDSWLDRVPATLRGRLRELLDTPDG